MNRRLFLHGFCLVAAVAALAAVAWQRSQLRELQVQRQQLEQRRSAPARIQGAASPQPAAAPRANTSPAPLAEKEKLELLRLRGELTRLRARQRELAGVRPEQAALRARQRGATTTTNAASAAASLPPGYVRRRDVPFAGWATPEATLQSFFWALEHQDTNMLFQALADDEARAMRETLTRQGTEAFWKELRILPGFRSLAREEDADGHVTFKVEVAPGAPPLDFELRKTGETWKLWLW